MTKIIEQHREILLSAEDFGGKIDVHVEMNGWIYGVVESVTADTFTIDGETYEIESIYSIIE